MPHTSQSSACSRSKGIGSYLEALGLKIAYTPTGIVIPLIFLGLPFVVRKVEPVLQDFDAAVEEAAARLGASRWQTFMFALLLGINVLQWKRSALALAAKETR